MIKQFFIILIVILLFLANEYSNNKILKTFNSIYKCYKIFLVIIPLVLFYFNPKLLEIVNNYLFIPTSNKNYMTKKDILFNLANLNNLNNSNLHNNHSSHNKDKCSPIAKCQTGGNYFGNNINQPKNKRNLSESTKKYVAANQRWQCKKCNNLLSAAYEVDHKVPLYKGGSNHISNLEALCRNCHGVKTLQDRININ